MTKPDDDRDGVLSPEHLAHYEVPGAPADFAARVMTRVAAAEAAPAAAVSPRRWRRWGVLGATTVGAAAVTVVMLGRQAGMAPAVERNAEDVSALEAREKVDRLVVELEQQDGKLRQQLQSLHRADEQYGLLGKHAPVDRWGKLVGTARPSFDHDSGHDTEAYSRIDDNPFFTTAARPLSTFSVDVDTASYANTRRFLRDGHLPPPDAVRIEELINYFHYDYPAPASGEPFSITTDVAASPWNPRFRLVRIGLQAPRIDDAKVPARNLVFLLDVSGSMGTPEKLPLLKQALGMLVEQLRPQDKVAIAVYAGASGVALPATAGDHKDVIRNAIARLEPGGSTNGAAGIRLAYDLAEASAIDGGINRVILCTDGDFNVGVTSEGELTRLIEAERGRGVFLTVLGFGMGNLKDATMEKLADRGNGNYAYIDSLEEARKVLVKEAGATLVTIAKDVKLQVEFDPAAVAGYRLIGYENRLLHDEDFNDDKKDAGDIGAGHSVTALYEIVPAGVDVPAAKVAPLKYQTRAPAVKESGELMTVKIRYKTPEGAQSKLLSRVVTDAHDDLASMSADFRWAAAIAGFGMMLRESPYRGNLSWKQVQAMAEAAVGPDAEGYRAGAVGMIIAASKATR